MEDDTEIKQKYLCEEIIEKSYNPDDFLEFIQQLKGEDASLDSFSMTDLKIVVAQFIKKVNAENSNNSSSSAPVAPKQSNASNESYENVKNALQETETSGSNYTSNSSTNVVSNKEALANKAVENYEEIVDCEKIEETPLSKEKNVLVTISNPEKHAGGMFSKSYITYLLTTMPLDFKVRRRYSDFESLRNYLTIQFPGLFIPPIPSKNYGDRFNDLFIQKRMKFLNKFLFALTSNPIIKSSQIFYEFVSLDENAFNTKKKEYTKSVKPPVKINEFKNLEGKLKLALNKDDDTHAEMIRNYANLNEIILKKIGTSYKALFQEIDVVSNRMKEISNLYDQLHTISFKTYDNTTVTDSYKMISKLLSSWGESMEKQTDLLNEEMKSYFKYIKDEFISFKELIAKYDINKVAYFKAESRLIAKKEDLFKNPNLNKWDISAEDLKQVDKSKLTKDKEYAFKFMMSKETQHVSSLRQFYAYYTRQVFNEFDRLRNLNGLRHKERVVKLSQNHSDLMSDMHVIWADILSYYTENFEVPMQNEVETGGEN